MKKNLMENLWVFSGVISRGNQVPERIKGEEMEKTIWCFNGLWNGECYRDWFTVEVIK